MYVTNEDVIFTPIFNFTTNFQLGYNALDGV